MSSATRRTRSNTFLWTVILSLLCFGGGASLGLLYATPRLPPELELPTEAASEASPADGVSPRKPPGRWNRVPFSASSGGLTEEQAEAMEEIHAMGYLAGSSPSPTEDGVLIHDREKAFEGLNFYVSGHAPEAILMGMDGNTLHRWACSFEEVWANRKDEGLYRGQQYWRRAHLLDNGDVLAIFDGLGLIKIDKDSNLLWASPLPCHHDIWVSADGRIYTLAHKKRALGPDEMGPPVVDDVIVVFGENGEVISQTSIYDSLRGSAYEALLDNSVTSGELFHTNTLEVLDGRFPGAAAGGAQNNVLVSLLRLNTVAIVDLEAGRANWALTGLWRRQHQPTILDDGTMMVFNNIAGPHQSEVRVIDPMTQETLWSYHGSPETPFYSMTCGSCQRLPNGNILITESDGGRAFEVTADKRTVWEFVNPHRAGEDHSLIATLFELIRLDPASTFLKSFAGPAEATE